MKKILMLSFLSLLFLSACGSDEIEGTTGNSVDGAATTDKAETKKELMRFYMAVPNAINKVDGGLNSFEQQQEEEILPEGEELEALKEAAINSAEDASGAIRQLEIPESLNDERDELQSALALISESYEMTVTALSEEETSFEAANEKFIEADEIFNTILTEYELLSSSIMNEVK